MVAKGNFVSIKRETRGITHVATFEPSILALAQIFRTVSFCSVFYDFQIIS